MTRSPKDENTLVRYLLGLMTEAERVELEELYLVDDDLNQELQAAERELIDRYLEDGLSETERKRFESFFLSSPSRIGKLRFARALKAYGDGIARDRAVIVTRSAGPAPFVNSYIRSYAGAAAFAVLAIAIGLVVWRIYFFQTPEKRAMLALSKAYQSGRLFQARISGLDHAPMVQSRGDNRGLDTALIQAESLAVKEANDNPGPRSLHALARVYLVQRRLDDALNLLLKASEADPEDAAIQSDLGAVFLERGRENAASEKGTEYLTLSDQHLSKALRLRGAPLEALFNRALCYELMHLSERAKEDWRSYLQRDASSGWAQEAREHLSALETQGGGADRNRSLRGLGRGEDAGGGVKAPVPLLRRMPIEFHHAAPGVAS